MLGEQGKNVAADFAHQIAHELGKHRAEFEQTGRDGKAKKPRKSRHPRGQQGDGDCAAVSDACH